MAHEVGGGLEFAGLGNVAYRRRLCAGLRNQPLYSLSQEFHGPYIQQFEFFAYRYNDSTNHYLQSSTKVVSRVRTKVSKQEHYDRDVWTNELMDELRRSECLCMSCKFRSTSCLSADLLFDLCAERSLAVMVTRCPFWQDQGGE